MKKIILFIILTGLFFWLGATQARASQIAGQSAVLATNPTMLQKDIENMQLQKQKIAIKNILDKYDSPMKNEVDSFMLACQKYSLDCYLLPSIAGLESTFGRFIYPNSNNPFGWGRGLIVFENWSQAIDTVASGLRNNYINHGASTIDQIGSIYCEGNTWAGKIKWFMKQFEQEEEKISLFNSNFPVKL